MSKGKLTVELELVDLLRQMIDCVDEKSRM